jgi:hypothetical protein
VNWIYIVGGLGLIGSIIGSARNAADKRRQDNIAQGIIQAQQQMQRRQLPPWPPKDDGQ